MRNRHKRVEVPKPDPQLEKIVDKIDEKIPEGVKHVHFDGGSSHEHEIKLRLRTQPITIGLPMDELLFSQFLVNFIGLDWMPWDNFATVTSTYLPSARNEIHNIFLNKHDTSHLLMLDSDVLPPPRLIERLLMHNKDMVGGWYVKKEKYGIKDANGQTKIIQRPVVHDFDREENGILYYQQRLTSGRGLESVGAAGAGCWLMSRKVAEALGENPYNMNSGGEDMSICKKIKDLGFELFVDWDIACAHCGVFFV
ncbi:MAG: hypothetical protein WC714_28955 [Candidatus Obscuribacterales bacterium]|jgi:hypothetical protein